MISIYYKMENIIKLIDDLKGKLNQEQSIFTIKEREYLKQQHELRNQRNIIISLKKDIEDLNEIIKLIEQNKNNELNK